VQKKNKGDVALPSKEQSLRSNYKKEEISKIILVQKFFRNMKFRMEVKSKILEVKSVKRKMVKNQSCNFKESWETYFQENRGVEFSINGLYAIKQEILEFYNDFFIKENSAIIRNEKNLLKNCINFEKDSNFSSPYNLLINEHKFSSIKKKNIFLLEFKMPILKQMADSYLMGELNTELEKICIEIQTVQMKKNNSIEEIKTLESNVEEEVDSHPEVEDENLKSKNVTNNFNNIFKDKFSNEGEEDDLFSKGKCPTINSKNKKISFGNSNEVWGKANTMRSDKSSATNSNNKTNFKTFTVNLTLSTNEGKNKNMNN
jgi:hypothetical protein